MRSRHLLGLAVLALCGWLTPAEVVGQFRGKGTFQPGGGFPGGGFPGGGFSGGSFRGPGGPPGGMMGGPPGGGMMSDPNRLFDMLARGRSFFLVTDTRSLREPLTQFAQERGITNGQITRELFTQFSERMRTQATTSGSFAMRGPFGATSATPSPGGFSPGGFGGFSPGGFSPGGFSPGGFNPGGNSDMMSQWAEGEFRRRDSNGDGRLNQDEMPDSLRQDLGRWDTNHDGLIDQSEHRGYLMARFGRGEDQQQGNAVTIILEEELDVRPTVYRAGKMPKEPRWLEELDTDRDGQVGLYEWRRGGKNLDDFRTYDHNDDGFITAEEALRIYNAQRANGGSSVASSGNGERPSFMSRDGGGERSSFGSGERPSFGSKMSREDFAKMREDWAKKKNGSGGSGDSKKRN
jgi:Ca2+-binding EF-hand superfamily protein